MTEIFSTFKYNGSRDPLGQIPGQSKDQKVIARKHTYSGNFLTEMESKGNFFQNDTKFLQIPQVVSEIMQFKIWRVPPFFCKNPNFLRGLSPKLQLHFQ